jgi:hypothetical protein
MPAPCIEPQVRDKLKVPPEILNAFADEMLKGLEAGMSYPDTLADLAKRSGIQDETINSMFRSSPRVFSITKQALARASRMRQLRDAADNMAGILKTDGYLRAEPGLIPKVWDAQRRLVLAGHSPVYPWTHMRNWAVQIPTEAGRARMKAFWGAAIDVYRYGGTKGKAIYEMDMALMKNADYYDFFRSSSLDVEPGRRTPGDILLQNKKPTWSQRNFDRLKVARYEAMYQVWQDLSPALREGDLGKAVGALAARDLNYATGSVMTPVGMAASPTAKMGAAMSQWAGATSAMLSSKLFFAKHMDAWMTPLSYLSKMGRMTPAERAASSIALKRWANTVGAHLSILGANYAFNKLMGWETPNLTDPGKADFLRIRLGNWVVPFSPMLESLRVPVIFGYAFANKGSDTAGTVLWRAAWNAAHPMMHTAYEQISGKGFRGQPVPSIRNLIAPVKSKMPSESLTEYLTTRFSPIAAGGGLHAYYQALRDHGIDAPMAYAWLKGAGAALSSALVGTHAYEEEQQKPKAPSRPSTTPTVPRIPPLFPTGEPLHPPAAHHRGGSILPPPRERRQGVLPPGR